VKGIDSKKGAVNGSGRHVGGGRGQYILLPKLKKINKK
jgi:hypothetical protein